MTSYIEYLKLPQVYGTILVAVFFAMLIIGNILDFKGKIKAELDKVKANRAKKKTDREALAQTPAMITALSKNINKLNNRLDKIDSRMASLEDKNDKNNKDTLMLIIETKRAEIINFATKIADGTTYASKEQFNRMFTLYDEYEKLINEHNIENGQIEISYGIIKEMYEYHCKNHTFLEDLRNKK